MGQGGVGRTCLAAEADNLKCPPGSKAVELFQREAEHLQNRGQDNPKISSIPAFSWKKAFALQ
ncbi:MAG: hypothetical protein ACO37W_17115 [Prochlorotrichaceae cyanobacterium]